MRTIRSLDDVQIVLRSLDDFKSRMEAKTWDVHGRQIKNGGIGTEPDDFVTLRQLGQFTQTQQQVTSSGKVVGFGEFSMEVDVVNPSFGGNIMVNNFSVDFPGVQRQRVNFCYTPTPVLSNLTINIMILKGLVWSVLETLVIPAGKDHSWPDADPYKNRRSPYNDSGIVLNTGDFLNFTCESGSSSGLMVKVNTYA